MSVLLAIGEPNIAKMLRMHLVQGGLDVLQDDVLHRMYLDEYVELNNPNMVILHDMYLPSAFETKEEKDEEILQLISKWRMEYDQELRVVYLCIRDRKDPFLAQLAARHVLDIFHGQQIDSAKFIAQLLEPAKYTNVAKFGTGSFSAGLDEELEPDDGKAGAGHENVDEESKEQRSSESNVTKTLNDLTSRVSIKKAKLPKIPTITKTKKVVVEKIVEKEVETIRYVSLPSKVIVVGSLYRGAGSTLLASNLAMMLGERNLDVAYLEYPLIPSPYMFDYLQIHQNKPSYVDIMRELVEQSVIKNGREGYSHKNVNWHPVDTRLESLDSFTYEQMVFMVHAIKTNILVIDISNRWLDPAVKQFLYMADQVLVCVDSDPIKLDRTSGTSTGFITEEAKVVRFLKDELPEDKWKYVMMKYHVEVEESGIDDVLSKEPHIDVPYIPYEELQNAILDMKLPYEIQEYQRLFEYHVGDFIREIVPNDTYRMKTAKPGLFARFGSRKEKLKQ